MMSFAHPLKRLRPVSLPFRPSCIRFISSTHSRSISFPGFGGSNDKRKKPEPLDNPIMRAYLDKQKSSSESRERARRSRARPKDAAVSQEQKKAPEAPQPNSGDLAPNSILNNPAFDETPAESMSTLYGSMVPTSRLFALDPKPKARRRFERRKIIQEIRRRGRVSKEVHLLRTERGLKVKSPMIRTSMKKLSPLANQIVGKTVDEAILQMEFSPKRAAVAVKEHLEMARNKAIIERGMGLGAQQGTTGEQAMIRLKDGKPHMIKDQTAIYVDQAWVGKGSYGRDRNRRARGRVDMLKLPQTSISVYLKEEKTRVREFNERQERELKRKPWIQMPDRPLPDQRQYYTW